jgi:hypothetical protein
MIFLKYWNTKGLYYQIQGVNVGLLIFFIFVAISDVKSNQNNILYVISDLVWIIGTIIVYRYMPIEYNKLKKYIKNNFVMKYDLIILLAISAILAVFPTMLQFKWDGALYEQACMRMNIHSITSMAAYSHIAQGYGILFCVARMIKDDPQIAMAMVNIVMYLGSICAFYGIVCYLIPDKKKNTYLISTTVYAFSPYTLGMVNYYSLDYATLCLFVCMLYFALRKQWVLQFVTALFFCFTKEPAIISYGAFCLGIVIVDFAKTKNIKRILVRPQYYSMLETGFLWVVTYLIFGGWNAGEGGTAIDTSYMEDKLNALYVLNFSWIFVLAVIAGLIYFTIRKKLKTLSWAFPIILSTLFYTLFSMMFKTVNNTRYTAQVSIVLYVLGISVILYVFKERLAKIVLIVLSVLLLASSYVTIDPVTKICFETVNVGNMEMITTGVLAPGDSMIYNKQMLGFEYVLNEAFDYAISNDYMVILPLYDAPPNLFDGLMQEEEGDEYGYVAYTYWDDSKKCRTRYESEETTPFEIYELYQNVATTTLPLEKYEKHCYIYSGLVGEERVEEINARFSDVEYKEFSAKGWNVTMVIF